MHELKGYAACLRPIPACPSVMGKPEEMTGSSLAHQRLALARQHSAHQTVALHCNRGSQLTSTLLHLSCAPGSRGMRLLQPARCQATATCCQHVPYVGCACTS